MSAVSRALASQAAEVARQADQAWVIRTAAANAANAAKAKPTTSTGAVKGAAIVLLLGVLVGLSQTGDGTPASRRHVPPARMPIIFNHNVYPKLPGQV